MTKVLVTGLGIANELGLCDSCNLNFSWLANNPSTLLWADEICIPKSAFKKQMNVNETKQDKTINMFLNMANKAGFIKQVDLTGIYKKTVSEDIYENVLKDSQKLIKTFPKEIKKGLDGDPFEIMIGDDGYCTAMLSAVYSGIKVAKDLDANCMFSKKDHTLLKYLYGLEANQNGGSVVNNIYDEIFSVYMPEGMALHNYSFSEEERCKKCVHYEACKGNYLTETEKTLKKC